MDPSSIPEWTGDTPSSPAWYGCGGPRRAFAPVACTLENDLGRRRSHSSAFESRANTLLAESAARKRSKSDFDALMALRVPPGGVVDPRQRQYGRIGGSVAGRIGDNVFCAGYAEDCRSKCQFAECKRPIAVGQARIGKKPPSVRFGTSPKTKWYCVPCVFKSFRRSYATSKTISSAADIRGLDSLDGATQLLVYKCIDAHRVEKAAKEETRARQNAKAARGPVGCEAALAFTNDEILRALRIPFPAPPAAAAAPPPAAAAAPPQPKKKGGNTTGWWLDAAWLRASRPSPRGP